MRICTHLYIRHRAGACGGPLGRVRAELSLQASILHPKPPSLQASAFIFQSFGAPNSRLKGLRAGAGSSSLEAGVWSLQPHPGGFLLGRCRGDLCVRPHGLLPPWRHPHPGGSARWWLCARSALDIRRPHRAVVGRVWIWCPILPIPIFQPYLMVPGGPPRALRCLRQLPGRAYVIQLFDLSWPS